jgi:hypothetical protein
MLWDEDDADGSPCLAAMVVFLDLMMQLLVLIEMPEPIGALVFSIDACSEEGKLISDGTKVRL